MADIDEELLEDLYGWVDQIPFSRPKRDIKRDFSDGVLVAEIVQHFCPSVVEIHNYAPANKQERKATNWRLMNRKVFKKLGFEVTEDVISNIVACKPWAVEQFLMMLRRKIDRHLYESERFQQKMPSDRPEADQSYPEQQPRQHYQPMTKSPQQQQQQLPPPKQNANKFGASNSGHSIGAKTSGHGSTSNSNQSIYKAGNRKGDVVPKVEVEEKEQEILVKEETIQILQAKVRRLEHLLHLKDIRIDDLQQRLDQLEVQLRPTANYQPRK